MQSGQPSRTALGAATHRAVHQIVDRGYIFADPLALRILGADAVAIDRDAESDSSGRSLRMFIAVRARFAEDALAAAVARGVRQLVVLGAGLDTYAYRTTFGESLRKSIGGLYGRRKASNPSLRGREAGLSRLTSWVPDRRDHDQPDTDSTLALPLECPRHLLRS
jgi:Leucine carboxyl methyltransferase